MYQTQEKEKQGGKAYGSDDDSKNDGRGDASWEHYGIDEGV